VERVDPSPDLHGSVIPNFCRGRAILPLVFVMQLVATVLTLADLDHGDDAVSHYILSSLYLQWLGLTCGAVLCWTRAPLSRLPPRTLFFACWGLLLVVTLAVSTLAWVVAHNAGLPIIAGSRNEFVYSNLCISAIIAPLLLRYFWVQNQWRTQMRAEGEARFQALHARIRPHFLFNSLNSVAALVATRPDEAERMIEDLSDLFRASLGEHKRLAPLAEEIETIKMYLRIEQVRLGDKLRVEWELPAELLAVPIPPLSLQPLVENAVVHGISRRREGGTIRIAAHRAGTDIAIEIENPMAPTEEAPTPGSGTAVKNIAQRLGIIYGGRAQIELGRAGDSFHARLRLPLKLTASEQT
jgi:two-component system sensor histidine kinase AlgZ